MSVKLGRKTTESNSALTAQKASGQDLANINKSSITPPLAVSIDMCELFPKRQPSIWKRPGQKRWMKWNGYLTDFQIKGVMSDEGRGLIRGCHWGPQTRFAVLDIDAGSKYHNAQELGKLQENLGAVGLIGTLYRSSESGGWHLYLFFDDWAASDELEKTIKTYLKAKKYEIRSGQLEVFPSGNALRLPLQAGFAWLDQQSNLLKTREELRNDEALASFLSDMETNAISWLEAKNRIESQLVAIDRAAGESAQAHEERLDLDGLERIYSAGKIEEIWEKGRKWWRNGLVNNGERHDAVLAVGHYLWYGDEERSIADLPGSHNAEYRAHLIEAWLRKNHNGKCRHINQGNWEPVLEQIQRAAHWRRDKEAWQRPHYPLTSRLLKRLIAIYRRTGRIWSIEQMEKANQDKRLEARARVAEAIVSLENEGLFITVAEVARRAKAHWNTVKKNWDLMALVLVHPLVEKQTSEPETNIDLLTRSSHVINSGGAGGFVEFSDPSHKNTKSTPKPLDLSEHFSESDENLDLTPFVQRETTKAITEITSQGLGNAFDTRNLNQGKRVNQVNTAMLSLGKIPLYPAFGSQRRLVQSLIVGLEGSGRKQNSHEGSSELAPIFLTPPYLLPGKKPSNEPPSSISLHSLNGFLPSYAEPSPGPLHLPFRQIDDGSPVRCNLGRTADVAGGLELSRRRQRTGKRIPVHGNQECGTIVKILVQIAVNHVQAELSASRLKCKGAKSLLTGGLRLVTRRKVRGPPAFCNSRRRMQRARKRH